MHKAGQMNQALAAVIDAKGGSMKNRLGVGEQF